MTRDDAVDFRWKTNAPIEQIAPDEFSVRWDTCLKLDETTIITDPEFARFRYDQLMSRRTAAQKPRMYWRGRGLGGSSAINGQIAIREQEASFGCFTQQPSGFVQIRRRLQDHRQIS